MRFRCRRNGEPRIPPAQRISSTAAALNGSPACVCVCVYIVLGFFLYVLEDIFSSGVDKKKTTGAPPLHPGRK